ncbi:hypothetical protein BWQ96_05514 [Gracilariopsis chorda]|uniref:Uncharacterized protein n=1 Tax=Gracilariopsis chorda TaxID=448386 RepID=A0A2V3IRL2_9FLOR|nr:hypothetical protein BWQ96_05514 [Gracilariopsis chorda]|eukprot:PXF44755.1 hypothetical protein BWQ96_05514 [Gracilariopsis chorda]
MFKAHDSSPYLNTMTPNTTQSTHVASQWPPPTKTVQHRTPHFSSGLRVLVLPIPTPVALTRFRGSNYTHADDSALARAWLRVWEDPVINSEQKSLDFFKRVSERFCILKPPTT